MRWLITNRNTDDTNNGFGTDQATLTYWIFNPTAGSTDVALRSNWQNLDPKDFRARLAAEASKFPQPLTTQPEDQKHVTLLVHGYNNPWTASVGLYDSVYRNLYDGPNSLGELISFDWPSKGSLLGYLPDRAEARQSGDDLANVLSDLYDTLLAAQMAAANNPENNCRAKTSIIAHSMGNYVLQCAANTVWTRKNRPLLVSLLQEVLMVAADVDNDLFSSGETVSQGAGEGLANLAYRITALYTGRDNVLGASAGLKHFGKRRLGRAGLDATYPVPDNIWEVDCTNILNPNVSGIAIHGEYFNEDRTYNLMRGVLQGRDRSILINEGTVPESLSRVQLPAATAKATGA